MSGKFEYAFEMCTSGFEWKLKHYAMEEIMKFEFSVR